MARTKGTLVIPNRSDYVMQAAEISRASYIMPASQRRMIYLAMAQIRPGDDAFANIEMKPTDVLNALGIPLGGGNYAELHEVVKAVQGQVIDIEEDDGWAVYNWFHHIRYIKSRDVIQMQLHDELAPYFLALQESFDRLHISDLTQLTGKYALRIFELVMTRKAQAGTNGMKPGHWFYAVSLDDLRIMFRVVNEYRLNADLRRRAIDEPIQEINQANLGIHITPVYEKRGAKLISVRFNCRIVKRDEPKPVTPVTETEVKEVSDLNSLTPAERAKYETYVADAMKQTGLGLVSEETLRSAAERESLAKVIGERPKKRGPKPKAQPPKS